MTELMPWQEHQPIVRVERELYKPFPQPGSAATVFVQRVGPALERMEVHALETRVDVPAEPAARFSDDNGRTWSGFMSLPPTLSEPAGVEVWEGSGCCFFDASAGVLVGSWLRQIVQGRPLPGAEQALPPVPGAPPLWWTRQPVCCRGLRYYSAAGYRLSWDRGRNWSPPRLFRYEEGADFDPRDPLKPDYRLRNRAYFGNTFIRLGDGTLVHPLAHVNIPGDPDNDRHPWPLGLLCMRGRWSAEDGDYRWRAGRPVSLPVDRAAEGLDEPAVAELKDGRVLVIARGTPTDTTPGRKWFCVSEDGGATLSAVRELTYDDGSRFYSPASIHHLIRHSVTGRLYWVGNISAVRPWGNWPRYPLVIAEVDESLPALKRRTVSVIADRSAGQTPYVEFSNFSLIENPETHDFEITLTAYGEDPGHINNAHCYRYRLRLRETGTTM